MKTIEEAAKRTGVITKGGGKNRREETWDNGGGGGTFCINLIPSLMKM